MKKAASFISHLRGLECHEKKRSLNEIHGENDTVPCQNVVMPLLGNRKFDYTLPCNFSLCLFMISYQPQMFLCTQKKTVNNYSNQNAYGTGIGYRNTVFEGSRGGGHKKSLNLIGTQFFENVHLRLRFKVKVTGYHKHSSQIIIIIQQQHCPGQALHRNQAMQ